MDLLKRFSPCFSGVFCPGDDFSKTTGRAEGIFGFKGKGS